MRELYYSVFLVLCIIGCGDICYEFNIVSVMLIMRFLCVELVCVEW